MSLNLEYMKLEAVLPCPLGYSQYSWFIQWQTVVRWVRMPIPTNNIVAMQGPLPTSASNDNSDKKGKKARKPPTQNEKLYAAKRAAMKTQTKKGTKKAMKVAMKAATK